MSTEVNATGQDKRKVEVQYRGGSSDAVYAIGLFGAWYYYISRARSFQAGALGFIKGFFWPALLVNALLKSSDKE